METLRAMFLLFLWTTLSSACPTCNLTMKRKNMRDVYLDRIRLYVPEDTRENRTMPHELRKLAHIKADEINDRINEDGLEIVQVFGDAIDDDAFSFPNPRNPKQNHLRKAELLVDINRPENFAILTAVSPGIIKNSKVTVRVFECDHNGVKKEYPIGEQVVEVPMVKARDIARINLITEDVSIWVQNDHHMQLIIEASFEGEDLITRSNMKAALGLTMTTGPRRTKRDIPTCSEERKETGCCLYDWTIDFERHGMNHIVAPRFVNVRMCAGDCQLLNHVGIERPSHHQGATQFKGSCCHPSSYDYLEVIYSLSSTELITSKIPDMIATRCTCL